MDSLSTLISRYVRPEVQAMSGYVPGEQPQAGKVIKLNTNENPYPPSPKVLAALEHACREPLQRYPDPKATVFRLQAADILNVEPDWILCGNGSDDVLTILTRTLVGSGQCICTPTPTYVLYPTLTAIQGGACRQALFREDWTLPDEFFELARDASLAILANPNSPSGTQLSSEQVAAAADRLACPLLVDEAYVDFADDNCLDLVRRNPQVMVSRSLSKSYALAGLRFGYLVAHPQWIDQLDKVRDSYNCDRLATTAATAAIGDQNWLRENVAKVRATRARLEQSLSELGFQVTPSQANFVWCRPPRRSPAELYQDLKNQGVLVRYMKYPEWGDGLRISVGTDAQIDALLALLSGN